MLEFMVRRAATIAAGLACLLFAGSAFTAPEQLANLRRGRAAPPWVPVFARLDETVFWRASTLPFELELWSTHPRAGTSRIGVMSGESAVSANGLIYFLRDRALMRSDGTALGTYEDPALAGSNAVALVELGGAAHVFSVSSPHLDLLRIEGERAALIRRFTPVAGHSVQWRGPAVLGDRVWFTIDAGEGNLLYQSDGTAEGTIVLHDFGDQRVYPEHAARLASGKIVFPADARQQGEEIWIADERRQVRAIGELLPGHGSGISNRTPMVAIGDVAYFIGNDGRTRSSGLFQTDGTLEGTRRVHDAELRDNNSVSPLIAAGRAVFTRDAGERIIGFGPAGARAFDYAEGAMIGAHGALWVATSTARDHRASNLVRIDAETFAVSVVIADRGYAARGITANGDEVWAVMPSATEGRLDVVAFDARGDRLRALGELRYPADESSAPRGAYRLGEKTITSAHLEDDSVWVEFPGPRVVDFSPATAPAALSDQRLLYSISSEDGATHLRTLSPNQERSELVRAFGGWVSDPIAGGGAAFFRVSREWSAEIELWRSDGASDNTRVLIRPDGRRGGVEDVGIFGDDLFLIASSTTGHAVWRYAISEDAFEQTPAAIAPKLRQMIGVIGGALIAVDTYGTGERRSSRLEVLWPAARTLFEAELNDLTDDPPSAAVLGEQALIFGPGRIIAVELPSGVATELDFEASAPQLLGGAGALMYFSARDPLHGRELWATDGRDLWLVRDLAPGPTSSDPALASAIDGRLFFAADDGGSGTELWISDGTEAGTHLVLDLNPGAASGIARKMPGARSPTAIGEHVYFAGLTDRDGSEPWRLPIAELDQTWVAPQPIAPNEDGAAPAESECGCRSTRRSGSVVGIVLAIALGIIGRRLCLSRPGARVDRAGPSPRRCSGRARRRGSRFLFRLGRRCALFLGR